MAHPASIVRERLPHEPLILPQGEIKIVFEGKIGAVVQYPVLVDEGNGYVAKTFEKFVRSPGTRIIAFQDEKIYLQQEVRLEKNSTLDWRLPGGKVLDTFAEFKQYLGVEIPEQLIIAAAQKELSEEASLSAAKMTLFSKQSCGATVEWDLYYLLAEIITFLPKNNHTEGEDIQGSGWFSFEEILAKCERGEINEGRTVAELLKFISGKNKK